MEKCIFSAYTYVEKFRNLIKIFNNYEGSDGCSKFEYTPRKEHSLALKI